MRDADAISRVKTDELHADVLIADVIKNSIFRKWMRYISLFHLVTYIQILHAVLYHKDLALYK